VRRSDTDVRRDRFAREAQKKLAIGFAGQGVAMTPKPTKHTKATKDTKENRMFFVFS
jgi:hypothetical protein